MLQVMMFHDGIDEKVKTAGIEVKTVEAIAVRQLGLGTITRSNWKSASQIEW
jgi:hypothetical protein